MLKFYRDAEDKQSYQHHYNLHMEIDLIARCQMLLAE